MPVVLVKKAIDKPQAAKIGMAGMLAGGIDVLGAVLWGLKRVGRGALETFMGDKPGT